MTKSVKNDYWASLIYQVRASLNLSQEAFANAVFSNQATVSRWEKGLVVPTYDKQAKIELMASEAGIASLGGLVEVIRNSPHRLLLIDQKNFIIASSESSEWIDNKYVDDQLSSTIAKKAFEKCLTLMKNDRFWNTNGGTTITFDFVDQSGKNWHSVITSVIVRSVIFAVVQQTVT